MNLKIERIPEYLSPSSLTSALKRPNQFFISRLIEDRYDKDPQTEAASYGTAFDIIVKKSLINSGIACYVDTKDIEKSLEVNHEKAMDLGQKLFKEYQKVALKQWNWKGLEHWIRFTREGVPLYVKLDASVGINNWEQIPFDWKVSGMASKTPLSPKPGYMCQYKNWTTKPGHTKFRKDIKIHQIDSAFATQFCTYGWSLGLSPENCMEEFPVAFDMLTRNSKWEITVSSYIAWVDIPFQRQTMESYKTIWRELNDGSYINRLFSQDNEGFVYLAAQKESWY